MMREPICAVTVAIILGFSALSPLEATGRFQLETLEMAAELRGAPVFASDGPEVGKVVDVWIDDEGRPQKLQMTIGATLGFGQRTIELSGGGFMLLRGAVVLDFTAAALKKFPEVSQQPPEK